MDGWKLAGLSWDRQGEKCPWSWFAEGGGTGGRGSSVEGRDEALLLPSVPCFRHMACCTLG